MKVAELMSAPIHCVSSYRSVQYASEMMAELEIGSLVVKDYDQTMGIITSRDVRKAHPNRIVADAMTPDPVTISADSFIWDALKIMEQLRIERLLVTRDASVVGMITRDAIRIRLGRLLDPLTGLFRQGYVQSIGNELLRNRERFQLLFIDLNKFGEINKRYGHPVGDDVIRGFAAKLSTLVAPEDCLCRYAGDEFVILSSRTEQEMSALIEAITEPIDISGVTVSAAVGMLCGEKEPDFLSLSFREIISRASLLSTSQKKTG